MADTRYMLGIVLLWIVVYLSGMLLCKIGREKETSQIWVHLTGFFFLFFCQGAVFFAAQLLSWNFRKASMVLAMVFFMVSLIAVVVCRKELQRLWIRIRALKFENITYGRYRALGLWLFVGLIMVIAWGTAGSRNDAMVETVQTTLMTDTMNQYHPFTRQPLELGMILSKKIITLPFWYSAVSLWTGLSAVDTVWILGTVLTVGFSLMAFGELASILFRKNFRRTWLLVLILELLYLSGDYYEGAAGYQILFYGYAGETIVATVMIPVVLCVLCRLLGQFLREDFVPEEDGISVWGAVVKIGLCLAVSLFLTSLAWGVMMVLAAIVIFLISFLGVCLSKKLGRDRRKRRAEFDRNHG